MAELRGQALRAAFRFGTGVGVVAGERDLEVCVARVRPGGARVEAVGRIEGYRERPAAEWGAEYAALVKGHGAAHVAALVVLPRHEVIVRQVRLPGVSDEDAPAAIRFQMDALHPYGDEEVVSDYRRAGRTDVFVVAVAERRHIDFYTALFAEAGVKLAGLTFSGGAVFPSLRLFGEPAGEGFVAVTGGEIYGESASHPLFSAAPDMELERALGLAKAEMRLGGEVEARELIDVLPGWKTAPDGMDLSDAGRRRMAVVWAAALGSACPHLGAALNLLPAEMRTGSSRMAYVPAAVLGVVLAGMVTALVAQNAWMDRRYVAQLESEVARLAPRAARVEKLDKELAAASVRIGQLDDFRKRTRAQLDVVGELTEMLKAPAYLMTLQSDGKAVTISGETEQADALLKKLDESPRFTGSEFTMPLARSGTGEVFRIKTQREGGR